MLSINPSRLPKFCFAWFEAICSTGFLGLFVEKDSAVLLEALRSLFAFMKPVAEAYAFAEPAHVLYKGLLKLLAVILHDCPQFLVQHHVQLCAALPPAFIQARNIILAAVPEEQSATQLPDPLAPGLKIDSLPGIKSRPELPAAFIIDAIADSGLVGLVDEAISNQSSASIQSILGRVQSPEALVNLIALRVSSAFSESSFKGANALLSQLLMIASPTVRYSLLVGMVNYLRYSNYCTYFFSCALLNAFRQAGTSNEQLKGQIVRSLLERLVVYRPHPWGLMITFMELIRNPEYRFWSQPLVKSSPELERMFETVAKSCLVN